MKIYVVVQEYIKDVQRKNSKTLSAKKGELRLYKAYATKACAEMEVNALRKFNDFVYKIKEVEID